MNSAADIPAPPTAWLAPQIVACHECDLLNRVPALPPKQVARCARCGGPLYRNSPGCIDRTLALALASLVLFIVANTFPFLAFGTPGSLQFTSLISGTLDLYRDGMPILALIVFATSVLIPALQIAGLIYVYLPLHLGRVAPGMRPVFRLLLRIRPWNMVEVFLVGILVAFVKLAGMAEIVFGIAIWAFGCLIITLAWANSAIVPHMVWDRMEALL
jgi:paraquat-inducible protein A